MGRPAADALTEVNVRKPAAFQPEAELGVERTVDEDDLPPQKTDEDDDSFSGQLGLVFGGVVVAVLLLALATVLSFGGIQSIAWIKAHLP